MALADLLPVRSAAAGQASAARAPAGGARGEGAPADGARGVRATHGSYARVLALLAGGAAVASTLSILVAPAWPPPSVRAAVAVVVALVVPGAPVVALLRPASRALAAALTVAISLSVTVLAAHGTLLAGWWRPNTLQLLVNGVTLVAVVAMLARWSRTRGPVLGGVRRSTRALGSWVAGRVLPLAALVAAAVLAAAAASTAEVASSGPLGLVTELGWAFAVAVVLVAVVLVRTLARPRVDHGLMLGAVAVLVVLTTSLVTMAEGEAAVPTAWVHRGFIGMIVETGELPPPIDARMSWAGFFAWGAHLTTVAALPDAAAFLGAAPVVVNGLLVAPLFVLGRAIAGSMRTAWLGVVVFVLANWYQQDYFAPQAMALLLLTTVLATLLWWWRAAPGPVIEGRLVVRLREAVRRTAGRPAGVGPGRAWATEAILVVIVAATVVSHQVTPVVMALALAVLAGTGSTRFRLLWLTAGLLFLGWLSLGATDFWLGHLHHILGDVGNVGGNLSGGVGERLRADTPWRHAGQVLRLACSGLLLVLAATGWWAMRHRRGAVAAGLLAVAPFGLVLVQSYGGEVVIRSFVLASPVLAPLAAVVVVRAASRAARRAAGGPLLPRRALALVVALTVVATVGVTAARGVNAAFEHVTRAELQVARDLLEATPGPTRVVVWGNAPYLITLRSLVDVQVTVLPGADGQCGADVAACTRVQVPDYVLLTPTQQAQGVLMDGLPPHWLDRGASALVASGEYAVVTSAPQVTLLRRVDVAGEAP